MEPGWQVTWPLCVFLNIRGSSARLISYLSADGGDTADGSTDCSGGRLTDVCFSSRIMWRENGQGEVYAYLPPTITANQALCNVPPKSICNPQYGSSVGRGAFNFKSGQANAVAMRVRLNDVGQANGEIQLWSNGESVINVGGLVLRDSDAGRIRGLQMQTFFGGALICDTSLHELTCVSGREHLKLWLAEDTAHVVP